MQPTRSLRHGFILVLWLQLLGFCLGVRFLVGVDAEAVRVAHQVLIEVHERAHSRIDGVTGGTRMLQGRAIDGEYLAHGGREIRLLVQLLMRVSVGVAAKLRVSLLGRTGKRTWQLLILLVIA